jgi:cell division protein FtsL
MFKLLISLIFALLLAAAMLQLRQQSLELNYESNRLHGQIEAKQAELWSQQLQIAEATAPNAIAARAKAGGLEMVQPTPETPGTPETATASADASPN